MCGLAVAAPAHANPTLAAQRADEAKQLVATSDFAGAGAKFREAYAIDARPEYLCNAGVAYWKAQQWPRAHRYLAKCAAIGSSVDQAFRDSLGPVIAAVDAKLAEGDFTALEIFVEPGGATIAIGDEEPLVGASRIFVPYGTHRVVVRAPGYREKVETITATSDAPIRASVVLERETDKVIVQPPPLPPTRERPVTTARPSRVPAIAASIATVAVGLVGTGLYVTARGRVDDAEDPTIDFAEFERRRDSAKSLQKASWIAGGLAGAGVVVSGYLWYRATRSVEVSVSPSAITLRTRF